MKQKNILYITCASLIVIVFAAASWIHYAQIKPIALEGGPDASPIVTFDDKSPNTSTRPTMTEGAKKQADAPGTKQPTVIVAKSASPPPTKPAATNAPKQDQVKQTVAIEQTYYPLKIANDPGYSNSWALQKVNAPAAWDISTGNAQTVVAVVDTGYALDHEDLKNNWLINNAETGQTQLGDRCWTGLSSDRKTNNCDDDNNGYVDDWRGWNFSDSTNNPMTGQTNPNGAAVAHGTEVAGLIGAAGNNLTGIATINWNTKIMPLQVLSDDGPGYTSDVAAAIYYAVDNGADVINLSLGGNVYDPALKVATDYAFASDVVVVAASGNCGTGNEQGCQGTPAGFIGYPALNDHVIAVGATTINDQRASFSSYGQALDVTAPGSGSIVSPTWTASNGTNLYSGTLYGTSYASPQVASLASLIKSIRPASSVDDITGLLLGTATKLPVMNGAAFTGELGHGVINASSALTVATSLNSAAQMPALLQAGGPVSEHRFASGDTLGSGCKTVSGRYCTVWLRSVAHGYDRYLPYQLANQHGLTGWTWRGNILQSGEWQVRATQGDNRTNSYSLSSK